MLSSPARALAALATGAAMMLSGCGGDTDEPTSSGNGSAVESQEDAPDYEVLGKPALTDALLGVQDLPPGYSKDPESPGATNKMFCDYKPPFTEKITVTRDFTKGGGLSSELLRIALRQYESAGQAKAAFEALTKTLETCTEDTFQGTKLTYAQMSVPKVGQGAVGVKIEADNATLLQNFALVGPTLVSTGGGGLVNADADEVANLLEEQVKSYEDAAQG